MLMDVRVVLNLPIITSPFLWRGQWGVIFSIPQSLSASNKIPVNLIMTTSVIVVVTSNGDRGRQSKVRQHKSPFFNS